MTSDSHNRLIASLGFRQLRDGMVAQIMKTEASSWTLDLLHISRAVFVSTRCSRVLKQLAVRTLNGLRYLAPRSAPALLRLRGVDIAVFASGENEMTTV